MSTTDMRYIPYHLQVLSYEKCLIISISNKTDIILQCYIPMYLETDLIENRKIKCMSRYPVFDHFHGAQNILLYII